MHLRFPGLHGMRPRSITISLFHSNRWLDRWVSRVSVAAVPCVRDLFACVVLAYGLFYTDSWGHPIRPSCAIFDFDPTNRLVQWKYREPLWIYRNCSDARSPIGRNSTRIVEILRAAPKSMLTNRRKCTSIRSEWNRHSKRSAAKSLQWSRNSRMPVNEEINSFEYLNSWNRCSHISLLTVDE